MKILKKMRFMPLMLILSLAAMMASPAMSRAAEPTVDLGTTSTYAVLAGSTVTNIGSTTIGGVAGGNVDGNVGANVGVSPGSAVTGFPPGIINDGGGNKFE